MTPFEISVALHYATCLGDFRDGDFSAPIFETLIPEFLSAGLLDYERSSDAIYKGTPKLKAYVDKLQSIPLPTVKYVFEDDAPW